MRFLYKKFIPDIKKFSDNKSLFLIYFIAHGLTLGFYNAQFYDDIMFYNLDLHILVQEFKDIGDLFNFRYHLFLFLRNLGPWLVSIMSFLLFFISAMIFKKILKSFFNMKKDLIFLFLSLYLVLPFGLIKFTLSVFNYPLCMTFFLIGWYLMIKSRITSLFFFFISFNMQSLLVLYALPILCYFYYLNPICYNKNSLIQIKKFIRFSINKLDFFLLPFLFFFIKLSFFKPSGYYKGYNQSYDLENLIFYPIRQFLDIFRNNLSIGFIIFGFFVSLIIIKCFFKFLNNPNKNLKNNFNIIIILIGLFGSLFPYWITSHTPGFSGYYSRNQLLMLIVVPFLIIFLINFLNKKNINLFLLVIFTLSLSINFKIYSDYYIDYWKQIKMIKFLKKNKEIFRNDNVIVLNDRYINPSVIIGQKAHKLRNGLFKRSLGNEKNFVIDVDQLEQYNNGKFDHKFNGWYMASEHKRSHKKNFLLITVESLGFLKFNYVISRISDY